MLEFSIALTSAIDDNDTIQSRPVMALLQPGDIMDHGVFSCFDAAVIGVDRFVLADLAILKIIGFLLSCEELNIGAQGSLIALKGDDVVRLLVPDFLCDGARTPHGVDGDDRAFYLHPVGQRGNGGNFIGLFADLDLRQRQALARGKKAQTVWIGSLAPVY